MPVYDKTFGILTSGGRRRVVAYISKGSGSVLKVAVGTGLSLGRYNPDLQVTGVDFSADMLEKARKKIRKQGLGHVTALRQMDARDLDFPDAGFDTIAATHVLSVVPEPEQVMSEIARVCKPGGKVVVTNDFMLTKGVLAALERI